MSFCRSLDGARSVSSSRQNTEKHGGQKKKVRPQRSHTGRRWAQHTEKVQSTRMITWKEDQKIKLQKFICECIYNWLFFLKTFFSFFSLFNFFFQPIQLCYIEAKHSCYVCSVSVQHAGSSPPFSSSTFSSSYWSAATAVATPPLAPGASRRCAFPHETGSQTRLSLQKRNR